MCKEDKELLNLLLEVLNLKIKEMMQLHNMNYESAKKFVLELLAERI